MSGVPYAVTLATALGCGLAAGVFFAFSTFVMRGLSRLPPEQSLAAMQQVNAAVTTALFGLAFFGTALVCVAIAFASFANAFSSLPAGLFLAGAVLYLGGVVGVTLAFNVPLNNVLPSTPAAQAAEHWPRYAAAWLGWNHVRTLLGSAALVCFVWGLFGLGEQRAG